MPRVESGDQAPATASAEAAERGEEEEQATAQHRRHSGSRGNENKGAGHTVTAALFTRTPHDFPCSTGTALGNYKRIIHGEAN